MTVVIMLIMILMSQVGLAQEAAKVAEGLPLNPADLTSMVVSAAVGGGLSGWLVKTSITRTLNKIDALEAGLNQMTAQLAAMTVRVGEAMNIREDVKEDHDRIIRVEGETDKCRQDLNQAWGRIRESEKVISAAREELLVVRSDLTRLKSGHG